MCWLILLIPNIYTVCVSVDLFGYPLRKAIYFGVVVFFLLLPATVLRRRTYFLVEGIIGLLWMPIEMASLYLNRASVSIPFLKNCLETNRTEMMEVASSVWPLLSVFLILCAVYVISVSRMENTHFFRRTVNLAVWTCIPVLAVSGIITMLAIHPIRLSNGHFDVLMKENIKLVVLKFYKIYPYNIYCNVCGLMAENRRERDFNAELKDFSFGLEQKIDSLEEHYILVLGEAARYDRFSRNGYSRPTSPALDTISNLFSLSNIYSQANFTSLSIPLLLTRADVKRVEIAKREKTIVDAFAEAGFQTAWISNQANTIFENRIAEDDHIYSSDFYSPTSIQFDDRLISSLNTLSEEHPVRKTFYVLHLWGSHFRYNERYPSEFCVFKPAMQSSDGFSVCTAEKKEILDNSYDNTIVYTDYVLSQIINVLRKQNGACGMLYISDHGENLCDDERNLALHSSYEGTEQESHIPCFVWLSSSYCDSYPEKVAALTENVDSQVSSDVIFYSLADLGDLEAIVDSTKSIFSEKLRSQDEIYMLNGLGTLTRIK